MVAAEVEAAKVRMKREADEAAVEATDDGLVAANVSQTMRTTPIFKIPRPHEKLSFEGPTSSTSIRQILDM